MKPKEYDDILKGFLGRDSYLHYGENNFPFITSELYQGPNHFNGNHR